MTPDQINGMFEVGGGLAVMLSIRRIQRDKQAKGISWVQIAFFTGWGLWNLWFYPSLDQWASFTGGIFVTMMNLVYLMLLLHYWRWGHLYVQEVVIETDGSDGQGFTNKLPRAHSSSGYAL